MFADRSEAGRHLAQKLLLYKGVSDMSVYGILRGGLVVAAQISSFLNLPLFPLVVKKITAPNQPELAIGAITQGGGIKLNRELIIKLSISSRVLTQKIKETKLRVDNYLSVFGLSRIDIKGKTIILVDDGVATGATFEAAVLYLRGVGVKKIIAAIPVAPKSQMTKMKSICDTSIVLETPTYFNSVGNFYEEFGQVSDLQVIQLLHDKTGGWVGKSR